MSWLRTLGIAAEELAIWLRRRSADRRWRRAKTALDVHAQKEREAAYQASVESAARRQRGD